MIDKLPKCAIIDESVCILPGFECENENLLKENLNIVLANYEAMLPSPRKRRKPKRGDNIDKKETGTASSVNDPADVIAKLDYTILTNDENSNKKLVFVHIFDNQLFPIGKNIEILSNESKYLVVLVEVKKIRPLYLVSKNKK